MWFCGSHQTLPFSAITLSTRSWGKLGCLERQLVSSLQMVLCLETILLSLPIWLPSTLLDLYRKEEVGVTLIHHNNFLQPSETTPAYFSHFFVFLINLMQTKKITLNIAASQIPHSLHQVIIVLPFWQHDWLFPTTERSSDCGVK